MKRFCSPLLLWLILASPLTAQVQLAVPASISPTKIPKLQNPPTLTFQQKNSTIHLQPYPQRLLPDYALENPQGLSYLCQLELDIEKKLPVGLWIEIEERPGLSIGPRNNAYFRLKLFNF